MENQAVINLKTLKRNALNIKKILPEKVKFCAVVKSDAYGHGAEKVANAIYSLVDCFAVATANEGVNLRLSGINKPILVLIPCQKEELGRAIRYSLTLTAQSVEDLVIISETAECYGEKVKVHIKFNSGMNRLGADLVELDKMLEYIKQHERIDLDGLFSHYSNAKSKVSVKRATDKFLLAIKRVKGYNNRVTCHISASGGFLQGQYFDMVRIGILLYGYKPFKSKKISVKPVMRVYAPVIKKDLLLANSNCMYGKYKTKSITTVSLVRYGYANGLSRRRVRGQINNRCMNITALKGIKDERVCVMDDADRLARVYKTISYEILVKCAINVQKIYIN